MNKFKSFIVLLVICLLISCSSHIHSFSFEYNEENHWHECECGYKENNNIHYLRSEFNNESHYYYCECGYISSEQNHILIKKVDNLGHYNGCECGYKENIIEHTFGDWISGETEHYKECECGFKTSCDEHQFGDWITDVEVTLNNNGIKLRNCDICSFTEVSIIDKLSDNLINDIKQYYNNLPSNIDEIYAYYNGLDSHDILRYILDFSSNYQDILELQFGEIVYVGNDEEVIKYLNDNFITISESFKNREFNNVDSFIETASSFYLQKEQIQYDQSAHRKLYDMKPEDATKDRDMYLDCSSFVNMAFYNTFGVPILDGVSINSITTKSLINFAKENKNSNEVIYYYEVTGLETSVEMESIIDKFKNLLLPGDIYVYRHGETAASGEGHAMLYIGDGYFLHSTGSSYNYSSKVESIEKNGSIRKDLATDTVYNINSKRHMFYKSSNGSDDTNRFAIIRPLNRSGLKLTKDAYIRFLYSGINIEKNASINYNHSLSVGETITYSLNITNNGKKKYCNISVIDYFTEGLEYIENSANLLANHRENLIHWNIMELDVGQTIVLNYSVKVTNEIKFGDYIGEFGYVNQLRTNRVYNNIRSVSTDSLNKLKEIIKEYINNENVIYSVDGDNSMLSPIENKIYFNNSLCMIDVIYKRYYHEYGINFNLFDDLSEKNAKVLVNNVFNIESKEAYLNENSKFYDIVVKGNFGGQYVFSKDRSFERLRLLKSNYLELGDIIIFYTSTNTYNTVIYVGDIEIENSFYENTLFYMTSSSNGCFLTGNDAIKKLYSYNAFNCYAVIRPFLI